MTNYLLFLCTPKPHGHCHGYLWVHVFVSHLYIDTSDPIANIVLWIVMYMYLLFMKSKDFSRRMIQLEIPGWCVIHLTCLLSLLSLIFTLLIIYYNIVTLDWCWYIAKHSCYVALYTLAEAILTRPLPSQPYNRV